MASHFSHIEKVDKPMCVLGVLDTQKGVEISTEMRRWLEPNYDLYIVYHDGSLFEYPALHFMQNLCKVENKPCLYIHTRGAVNVWRTTKPTHRLWRHEFVDLQENYFRLVDADFASVACPFTGEEKTTFYNGFVVNPKAMQSIPEIQPNEDRLFFENIFKNSNVKMYGTIYNNVTYKTLTIARQYLYKNYL